MKKKKPIKKEKVNKNRNVKNNMIDECWTLNICTKMKLYQFKAKKKKREEKKKGNKNVGKTNKREKFSNHQIVFIGLKYLFRIFET